MLVDDDGLTATPALPMTGTHMNRSQASSLQVRIVVNGVSYDIIADGDTPLLWILRDRLGLTGAKYGCGRGFCGACLVHLNGTPVSSCTIPLRAVGNQRVLTIEGTARTGARMPRRLSSRNSTAQLSVLSR